MKEALKSFFGLDDESDDDELLSKNLNDDIAIDPDFVMSTDMLLAAIMEAYRVMDRDKDALDLFLTKYEHMHENESLRLMSEKKKKDPSLSSMHSSKEEDKQRLVQSANEALRTFFKMNNDEDARLLFRSLNDSSRTAETYIIMVGGLVEKEPWSGEISQLYQSAVQSKCLTEELAFLAMKSVVFSKLDGKMRVLRDIIADTSSVLNISPEEFNSSRYWQLKRTLGYRFAKLLMWWRNLSSSWEKELKLSVRQLKQGRQGGHVIDEDALRCIVKFAGHNQRDDINQGVPVSDGPSEKDQVIQNKERKYGIKLIREVVVDAHQTTLYNSPAFVDDVAIGFCSLKAYDECIKFVKEMHSRDLIKLKQSTYEHAIYAAEEKKDLKMVDELIRNMEDGCSLNIK
uniref:Uncharacterized protein n=1 Tax=Ditylum brightwellii TaxID=49249 RepID=A0A7S1ZQV2_9STRA|mmetsp:Transcript_36634/g.54706  ORF Transcript_36634/g.54706 Transcript_36634/m.54706 type:complete len:400 (+) Transcript_36634:1125-2324(+)